MAELSLPASVNFSQKLPTLADDVRTDLLTIQANNGQSFTSGNVVNFDLPSRAGLFLDPKSFFIRYKVNYTVATAAVTVRGIPALSHISKLDEYMGSQPINSVYAYNQSATMWANTNMSIADKYGMQSSLGLSPIAGTPTLDQMDSRTVAVGTDSYTVAFPLVCSAFASADHLIPTGLMPAGRIQLTIAAPSEFLVAATAANMTAYSITNCELCVAGIQLGVAVENMVAQMGPRLYLRCNGWANSSQTVASGASGVQSLPFNHRYKSVENLFMLFSGTNAAVDLNAWADSRDITSSGGSYQVVVGSQQFPLLPIDTAANKAGTLQYLRECTGSITDFRNSMSINSVEFNYIGSGAVATTAVEPAKYIVGIPLSKVQSADPYKPSSLLSGVDCASTPILATVRIGTATTQQFNATMVAQYTLLIEIDPMTKQVNIIQ